MITDDTHQIRWAQHATIGKICVAVLDGRERTPQNSQYATGVVWMENFAGGYQMQSTRTIAGCIMVHGRETIRGATYCGAVFLPFAEFCKRNRISQKSLKQSFEGIS